MKRIKIISTICLLISLTTSCLKNEPINLEQIALEEQFNVVEIEGRLVFKDRESFDKTVDFIQQSPANLETFNNSFSNFCSSNSAFERISDEFFQREQNGAKNDFDKVKNVGVLVNHGDDLYFEPVVFVDVLSSIFNVDGIVQIADSVYKLTREYTIQGHIDHLQDIIDIDSGSKNGNLIFHHNILENIEVDGFKSDDKECRVNYDSRYRRLRGGAWTVRLHLYNSIYISSTNLRRPCRGSLCPWYRRATDYIEVSATGVWHYPDSGLPENSFDFFENGTNTARVSKNLDFTVNANLYPEIKTFEGHHMLEWGTTTVQCNTNM